jgi:hypothetical protein
MADDIIGIALKRDIRMVPAHPQVERIMQEEIRQEGADYSPYAKGNFTFDRVICGWRTGLSAVDLRLKK